MRQIVNSEWWVIQKNPSEKETFSVVNTHRKYDSQGGCSSPTVVKDNFMTKDEAINFLEEEFNKSRNR